MHSFIHLFILSANVYQASPSPQLCAGASVKNEGRSSLHPRTLLSGEQGSTAREQQSVLEMVPRVPVGV